LFVSAVSQAREVGLDPAGAVPVAGRFSVPQKRRYLSETAYAL